MTFSEFAFYWIAIGIGLFVLTIPFDRISRMIIRDSGPIEGFLGVALCIAMWPIMPMCWTWCVVDWFWKRLFGWSLFD